MGCYFFGIFMEQRYGDDKSPIKQEYIIEIVNQNTVLIYSPSTDITYKCKLKEIDQYLLKDNL